MYSATLGSPAGTTTGGTFRFTCTPTQAPCKVSYGAAVISDDTGNTAIYPRILIHKEAPTTSGPTPIVYCEYADGANNGGGSATISRVANLGAAVTAMETALDMGVGGSLDCGAGQTDGDGVVTEIWVPAASSVDNAYYDVTTTFQFAPGS